MWKCWDHSDKLISKAVCFIEKNGLGIDLLVKSFQQWGKLSFLAGIQEGALEKMQEVEKLCLSGLGVNSTLYGRVLRELGQIYHHLYDSSLEPVNCAHKTSGRI